MQLVQHKPNSPPSPRLSLPPPQVIGWLDSKNQMQLVQHKPESGFFHMLDNYLRTQKVCGGVPASWGCALLGGGGGGLGASSTCSTTTQPDMHMQARFSEFFRAFDADRSGFLDMAEMRTLVQKMLPNATEAHVQYFQVGGRGVGWGRGAGRGSPLMLTFVGAALPWCATLTHLCVLRGGPT